MTTTHAEPPRLRILEAVREGWQAFCRAPWPFVLFTLLTGSLNLLFNLLSSLDQLPETLQPSLAVQLTGLVVGVIGQVVVSLWGSVGLIRGAWSALEGQRPDWRTLSRWDGGAAGRLLVRQLVYGLLILGVIVLAGAVAIGLAQLQQWLMAIPAIAALVVLIYLAVNQTFLPWVALLQGPGPIDTLQRGREAVDPQWWWVVLLALLQTGILLLGLMLCGVGLLAAAPVALCVATAAYRQLFGTDDRTGLLTPPAG